MSKYTWPTDEQLAKALAELGKLPGSRELHSNASLVDRIKYELCRNFVIYLVENDLSQKELAKKLGIDPALMSKILRYHFDEFTIDRLVRFLEIIDIEVSLKVA